MLKKGEKIPRIVLRNDRNKNVDLTELCRNQFLVVFFYPRDYVPTSTKESCIFRDRYQDFVKAGAEIIGISSDSVDSHRTFKENFSLPFMLLSDEENRARDAFNVPKKLGIFPGRATFVIDKNGVIQFSFLDQFHVQEHVSKSLIVIENLNNIQRGKK